LRGYKGWRNLARYVVEEPQDTFVKNVVELYVKHVWSQKHGSVWTATKE